MTAHDSDEPFESDDDRRPDLDSEFDEMFTLAELARLLRVPEATLRYWRNQHIGPPSFKIGRHVRYSRTDVERWLREQRDAGGPDAA
jgi:excisionase family DNA binding protein